ncbi:MAG: 3-oxoacyl-[acyl-carrier protein] reductase [Clostridiales bacterium]|jgi:3-oxoacyl-[acyl-carrier protein] reductase|nr:3-oxoacyl-[acyl-carrier protein] reductase [Clostridiales bacterium]MDK2932729.1 3-oxoacyl-[acyl-carrier protein] reductase [Clostridiales bacterium]
MNNRAALITGASLGIGAETARELASIGFNIGINYRSSEAEAHKVKQQVEQMGRKAILLKADVSQEIEVKNMVNQFISEFRRIDVLVNNAGVMIKRCPVELMDLDLYNRVMDVNVKSCFLCSREVIPYMKKQKWGRIINLSSISAFNGGGVGAAIYAASKGAIVTFTKALSKEVAEYGIRVNAVAPGTIDTPFHSVTSPKDMEDRKNSHPLKRHGRADEISAVVGFLVSERADYISGATIDVNGGEYLR